MDERKYELRVLKTLIDLFDLQNDLGGQSCKSKLFLEKLVEQIILIQICRRINGTPVFGERYVLSDLMSE